MPELDVLDLLRPDGREAADSVGTHSGTGDSRTGFQDRPS